VIAQAISLVGAGMILAAFAANQAGKLGREDLSYLLLNLVGSMILTYFAWQARNAGLTALEGAWALISLFSLLKRRSTSPPRPGAAAS
jgi:hypothetical protein